MSIGQTSYNPKHKPTVDFLEAAIQLLNISSRQESPGSVRYEVKPTDDIKIGNVRWLPVTGGSRNPFQLPIALRRRHPPADSGRRLWPRSGRRFPGPRWAQTAFPDHRRLRRCVVTGTGMIRFRM